MIICNINKLIQNIILSEKNNTQGDKMSVNDNKQKTIEDTKKHINKVGYYLCNIVNDLINRANNHDKTKLEDPEIFGFTEYSNKLSSCEYGSNEYKNYLKDLKPTLDHHYSNNDHHPEYYENGINDMSLIQLIEMLADWKASCDRVKNGDILKSIEINQKRFGYSDDIKNLLLNTVKYLKW